MSQPLADSDEILDLVDDNDLVIGQIRRGDLKTLVPHGGKYVRAVDIFIMRNDGKIWIPTRSMHKSIAPGGLDFSVGAHVASGDTYEQTAVRELNEEAGLTINPENLEHIANIAATDLHHSHLYLLRTDTEPRLSDEHTSGEWMDPDDLRNILEKGVSAKISLLPDLELLKNYLSHI